MKSNKNALSLEQIGGHARQGDTMLRRIQKLPLNLKRSKGKATLALGEKTNHHHTFADSGAIGFADDETARIVDAVQVDETSVLTHQEHDPITFPRGNYESLKQVEDTSEEIRAVAD